MSTLLTIHDLAALLQMSVMSVRRRWADGTLPPPHRIGKLVRWHPATIDAWLATTTDSAQREEVLQ